MKTGGKDARLHLPVTEEHAGRVPFVRIAIEDSTADFTTETWQAFVPLRLDWEKAPVPKITYRADGVVFKRGKMHAVANGVKADAALDSGKQAWRGAWSAEKIDVAGTPMPMPSLHGGGTIEATAEKITVAGNLRSDDGTYAADFSLSRPLAAGGKTLLTVTRAAMPWKEGSLAAGAIRMTLGTAQKTDFNLEVAHVSIGALMQSLTGEKVTATGAVSGTIPVTISKDGAVGFGQGTLTAEGPGSIIMPPEAIPGDNEQIALVRDIMKDFRYSQLSIAMDPAAEKGFSVMLTVEGNNPAVYNGRSVKLNVRLTGDVLDFIRQNIIFLTEPETLLEQGGAHEKN
ncbi:MAG: YdbH domain-containing protein [Micavibrio aeruginosavorus]|nr:YdbH domain-containing protein [Micavibrio aeruginosavorus]